MTLPHDESTYRTAAAALMACAVVVGGYHRAAARRRGGAFSRAGEPMWIFVPLRLSGVGMFAVMAAYFARPAWLGWAVLPLPAAARWAGAAAMAIALALMFWTLRSLGTNLTDTVGTRTTHTLVTHGPYRFVRHPFYTTAGLMIVGMTLLTAVWPLGAVGAVTLGLLAVRTPIEEAKLVDRFGDAYRRYMARTPRFVPGWRHGAP